MRTQRAGSTDRVWFITGASSGFGRATTLAVLEAGGRVGAAGLEPEAIEQFVLPYGNRALTKVPGRGIGVFAKGTAP